MPVNLIISSQCVPAKASQPETARHVKAQRGLGRGGGVGEDAMYPPPTNCWPEASLEGAGGPGRRGARMGGGAPKRKDLGGVFVLLLMGGRVICSHIMYVL